MMSTNDALRTLRYILNVPDKVMCEIAELGGIKISLNDMASYLAKEDEPSFVKCPDRQASHFLNGLVIFKRGADPTRPPAPLDLPVDNNVILKKVRVAFQLTDEDIVNRLEKEGLLIRKSEFTAFFRKKDHPKYRPVGDQILRYLLKSFR